MPPDKQDLHNDVQYKGGIGNIQFKNQNWFSIIIINGYRLLSHTQF